MLTLNKTQMEYMTELLRQSSSFLGWMLTQHKHSQDISELGEQLFFFPATSAHNSQKFLHFFTFRLQ